MVAFAVGCPYPPCTVSLEDLQPLKLADLRMDTHHRGHVLIVRRIADVVRLAARSWTVVEEVEFSDEAERLEIFLNKTRYSSDMLESGTKFKIKEPYFTLNDQGEPTLRIDHPSDLICVDGPDNDRKEESGSEVGIHEARNGDVVLPAQATRAAKDCKEQGNAALKEKALLRAHVCYSNGIQSATRFPETGETISHDLFRNRAHLNLLLHRYDEAEADATAAVTGLQDDKHRDLDSKAYFRAGCAAYSLGDFQKAKSFFEKQKELNPDDKDATASVRKTEMRLHEQSTGEYAFKRIKAGLSKARPRVDAASFISNVEIKPSPGRGRGLFATRQIGTGEIVLCEKAFCVVWGHEDDAWTALTYDVRDDQIRIVPAGLRTAIVQKLLNNPSQVTRVMELYGDYEGLGKQLMVSDGDAIVDTFQVHDIVARNAFGPGPAPGANEDITNASTGLWVQTAYANHSCLANSSKDHVGDLMILRATQPISAGDEITHSYDSSSDYDTRMSALMTTWGFKCTCALCNAEEADGPALRKTRRDLESQADAFIGREAATNAKRLVIQKAERIARSIDETYDADRYSDVPRPALMRIQLWLTEAKKSKR